ncbi:hypothetical protein [Clostridium paraputrificum]|uniref:hypothetical protein n=1 Tax=Clostridium paraputrificum TaxID=29363 RepID=UPI000DD029E6|nr:hypothetical protein [Clostridium paraputrificum]MDB2115668.1 hypothetical protein [Clostridium paraputrificum]
MKNKKQSVFSEFIENKKFVDYFNIFEMECRNSLIITIIIIATLYIFKVYENYDKFIETFRSLSQNIGVALVSLLGIIFAGIALIIGILKKQVIHEIDKINGKDTTKKLLVSFKFLVVNIGFAIMVFFYIYIILNINIKYIPKNIFYIILGLVIYYFCFLIFYTVSLILNTIRIYFIVNRYEELVEEKRSVIDEANEIRIDFILNTILRDCDKEEFINSLKEYVDNSSISDKKSIKEYFDEYYN